MYYSIIVLSLVAVAVFGTGVATAQAGSYFSCTNSYTQGVAAPQGYGAAYDKVFGGLDISVDCNGNTLTVGAGNQNQYIYKLAYVYQNGWQQLNLASASTLQADNWYTASAIANLGNVDLTQSTYVVGYVCDWTGSVWKCGCADIACAAPAWQLQEAQGTRAESTTATTVQGNAQICYSWTGTCNSFKGTLALTNNTGSWQNVDVSEGGSYSAMLAAGTYSVSVNMGGSCTNYSVSPSTITISAGQTLTQDLTITETPCPSSPSGGGV